MDTIIDKRTSHCILDHHRSDFEEEDWLRQQLFLRLVFCNNLIFLPNLS